MISHEWWNPTLYGWPREVILAATVDLVSGQPISLHLEARSGSTGELLGLALFPFAPPISPLRLRAVLSVNLLAAIQFASQTFPA